MGGESDHHKAFNITGQYRDKLTNIRAPHAIQSSCTFMRELNLREMT